MTVVTPKTNFIILLSDIVQCLKACAEHDYEGYVAYYEIKPLIERCRKALNELEEL